MLRLAGKEARHDELVKYKSDEMLTTREKKVDCSKARLDLKHQSTVSLEAGIGYTLEWMRDVYKVE